MKIQTISRTFRLPNTLNDELTKLADFVQRHPSQLLREATSEFVRHYRHNPEELMP
jgi:predicted transcriptional regulator